MSRLKELIAEAESRGEPMAFYWYGKEDGVRGFDFLEDGGIKEAFYSDAPAWIQYAVVGRKHQNLGFNEAVTYLDLTTERTQRSFLRSKTKVVPVTIQDLLGGNNEDVAAVLKYIGTRREAGSDTRGLQYITKGIVSSKRFIDLLAEEVKKQPGQVITMFEGRFPKWEKGYTINPNGKILIARRSEVTPENAANFIHNYDVPS